MIRNIVFDMGNVLLDFNPARYLKRFVPEEADRPLLCNELFRSVEWVMTDYGVMTDEQVVSAVCGRVPQRLHPVVKEIMSHWHEDMPAYPEIGSVIWRLKEEGYRLYVLSNVGVHYGAMRRGIPHIERFDGEFISSDWRLAKPDPAIFSAFCQHFSLVPAQCFMIDDQPANIYGAMRIGMKGMVYYGDPTQIEPALRRAEDEQ